MPFQHGAPLLFIYLVLVIWFSKSISNLTPNNCLDFTYATACKVEKIIVYTLYKESKVEKVEVTRREGQSTPSFFSDSGQVSCLYLFSRMKVFERITYQKKKKSSKEKEIKKRKANSCRRKSVSVFVLLIFRIIRKEFWMIWILKRWDFAFFLCVLFIFVF